MPCSAEGPHLHLKNERRERAPMSQEHPNGDLSFLSSIFPNLNTQIQACTPQFPSKQHSIQKMLPEPGKAWEEAGDHRDPKTTRQHSELSQYQQHGVRGAFKDHHYDTYEQQHSEAKRCEDTHERADASTTQPEIHDPTQQARPTAEEQLQCRRKVLSEEKQTR